MFFDLRDIETLSDDARGVSGNNRVRLNVFGHHRSRRDDRAPANTDTRQYSRAEADPNIDSNLDAIFGMAR
ncbi:hypothetical protein GCM10011411_08390 [Aurantiacibacter arachoides]|nr:hypothetical protein GCM10011411_08390 [Aurantiacibacter arachoides]